MAVDQLTLLRSVAAEVVPAGGLEEKLALAAKEGGRPLRVKLGLDPTAPSVTLGWAVVLRTLRRFQDLGHTAILIVGDFTARVGDPSGRSDARPRLTADQVDGFAAQLLERFGKIVDMERVELRRNSEWLEPLGMEDILRLTASTTVARMLERDDFAARFAGGKSISLMEFLYPLLQGYDSVAVRSDIELGGTDQLFNLLVGRDLQKAHGQEPQVAFTVPLLEGTDGVNKMSQSLGNYIGIEEPPDTMFGKLMSIPDHLIAKYELLCTDLGPDDNERVRAGLEDGAIHPNDEKRRMAGAVVDLYHGEGAGAEAGSRFEAVFKAHEIPDDVPGVELSSDVLREGKAWLPRILVAAGLATSNAEARRAVAQGGVRLDGETLLDPDAEFDPDRLVGKVVQVGRRRFVRITSIDDR
jgi:tyrosyl-tRNA synthetase